MFSILLDKYIHIMYNFMIYEILKKLKKMCFSSCEFMQNYVLVKKIFFNEL